MTTSSHLPPRSQLGSLPVLVLVVVAVLLAVLGQLQAIEAVANKNFDRHIRRDYNEIFANKGRPMRVTQTIELLQRMNRTLTQQVNPATQDIFDDVKALLAYDRPDECQIEAAQRVDFALVEYKRKQLTTVVAYLNHCRERIFEVCQPIMVKQVEEAEARLDKSLSSAAAATDDPKALERFKVTLAKAHELTEGYAATRGRQHPSLSIRLKEALLEIMLGPTIKASDKTIGETEFEEQFKRQVMAMCEPILREFQFFSNFTSGYFCDKSMAKQLAKPVLDWFKVKEACSTIDALGKVGAAHLVLEHLRERPKRSSKMFGVCFGSCD